MNERPQLHKTEMALSTIKIAYDTYGYRTSQNLKIFILSWLMGWKFSSNVAVMQTEGFEYLKESCPYVLTELLEYVARVNEHSIVVGKQGVEGIIDGGDVHGRRVKQRL